MTPEAQRMAIAEACPKICFLDDYGEWCWKARVPLPFNPIADINAMHEAVLSLSQDDRMRFQEALSLIADREAKLFVELEASHWSEVFLKTIGKWENA